MLTQLKLVTFTTENILLLLGETAMRSAIIAGRLKAAELLSDAQSRNPVKAKDHAKKFPPVAACLLTAMSSPVAAAAHAATPDVQPQNEDIGSTIVHASGPVETVRSQAGSVGTVGASVHSALASLWDVLAADNGVVVVGFDLAGDIRMCCTSFPQVPRCWNLVIDLQALALPAQFFSQDESSQALGLQALVSEALHVWLDKTQQTSDWSARPLTVAQQIYAALDAYILIPLFEALLERMHARLPGQVARGLIYKGALWRRCVCPITIKDRQITGPGPSLSQQYDALEVPLLPDTVRLALVDAGLPHVADTIGTVHTGDSTPVKTIALRTPDSLVLCVLRLNRRLLMQRCASVVGVRRGDLSMVRRSDLVRVVGYPHGAIGPIGARTSAIVLIDRELVDGSELGLKRRVLCGAGAVDVQFCAAIEDLLTLTSTYVADFSCQS